jgi:transcription elongation factor Elf1
MNPFVLFNIVQQLKHKARICPVCRHKQLVPKDKEHTAVQCDRCGASIQPQQKDT